MFREPKETIEKVDAVMLPLFKALKHATEQFRPFVALVQKWQVEKSIAVSSMAENDWFLNWFTIFFNPEEKIASLDDFMMAQIDDSWEDIKNKMYEFCPKRSHIFDVIFRLHEERNYTASIPLIFTQADGICGEEFGNFFLRMLIPRKRLLT